MMTRETRIDALVVTAMIKRPDLAARLDRAGQIALRGHIEHLTGNVWVVSSMAEGNGFYRVHMDDDLRACDCDCPDKRQRGGICKHVLAVCLHRRAVADEARERAQESSLAASHRASVA